MVQRQSGDAYANAYCKETGTHAKRVGLKEIPLITSFQDTHLLKEMLTRIQTFKHCVFRVILRKVVGFLIGERHP
jgi:hypothetical protein